MVFVAMGDDQSLDTVQIVHDVRVVGNDIINAQQVIFGELDTRIHDDDFVLVLDAIGVLSDFSQTTDGKNANFLWF